MNIAQLQALVAVVDAGSFTAAGAVLGITQSGISHAVAALEADLGVTLLARDRTGVTLTDAGQRVLREARAMLAHADRLQQEAQATAGLARGRLLIGSIVSAAWRILPAAIGSFCRRYPGIDVALTEGTDGEVREWIASRAVDVGVVTAPIEGLEVLPLARDTMIALVPAEHALAHMDALRVERMVAESFIMSKGGCEPLIRLMFRSAGVQPRVRFEAREMTTIVAMVAEGLGVSVAPSLSLPSSLDGVRVVPLVPPTYRELVLAVRALADLSPAASAFVNQLRGSPCG